MHDERLNAGSAHGETTDKLSAIKGNEDNKEMIVHLRFTGL